MTHHQKGISSLAIILLLAFLTIGGGYYYASSKKVAPNTSPLGETHMMDRGDKSDPEHIKKEMMEGGEVMKKDSEPTVVGNGKTASFPHTGELLAGSASPLIDFNKKDYDSALLQGKPLLLYFYASWCPLCKEETSSALYPAFDSLLDEKIVGFRVNYKDGDTDKDEEVLAKQFGIAYQHTKVILKNGKQVVKSLESWDKARYLKEINAL